MKNKSANCRLTSDQLEASSNTLRRAMRFFKNLEDMALCLNIHSRTLRGYIRGEQPMPAALAMDLESIINAKKDEFFRIEILKEDIRPDLFKKTG